MLLANHQAMATRRSLNARKRSATGFSNLGGLLVAALIFLAPSFGTASVFNPAYFKLKNGFEVVVIENHRVPAVIQMLWYKVGAADEAPGQSGVAHLLEHLMFKGTQNTPAGECSAFVRRHGGRESAFTSWDYTG